MAALHREHRCSLCQSLHGTASTADGRGAHACRVLRPASNRRWVCRCTRALTLQQSRCECPLCLVPGRWSAVAEAANPAAAARGQEAPAAVNVDQKTGPQARSSSQQHVPSCAQNHLEFLRIRSQKYEIMVAPRTALRPPLLCIKSDLKSLPRCAFGEHAALGIVVPGLHWV